VRSSRESRRRSASQADQTLVVDCSIWLTQVKLTSNFIFVNRPLRFDPSLVTCCKHSLQSARLSKGYLRAVVLAPNARHLVACATSLPPYAERAAKRARAIYEAALFSTLMQQESATAAELENEFDFDVTLRETLVRMVSKELQKGGG